MACRGICDNYAVLGIAMRDWDKEIDLRRCSTCDIIIHRKDWVISKLDRKICPCCKLQLKTNSRGKRAREKRSQLYWKKVEVV